MRLKTVYMGCFFIPVDKGRASTWGGFIKQEYSIGTETAGHDGSRESKGNRFPWNQGVWGKVADQCPPSKHVFLPKGRQTKGVSTRADISRTYAEGKRNIIFLSGLPMELCPY